MPREHDHRLELDEPIERVEILPQRVRPRIAPPSDVGRDLVEEDVAAEELPAPFTEERNVPVGVAGQDEDRIRLAAELDQIAFVDKTRRLGRVHEQAHLVGCGCGSQLRRHAMPEEVPLESLEVALVTPAAGELGVSRPLNDLRTRERRERRARTDVIRVVVRDHDLPDPR